MTTSPIEDALPPGTAQNEANASLVFRGVVMLLQAARVGELFGVNEQGRATACTGE